MSLTNVNMAESQSRYSIVERLTEKKLHIMQLRSSLKEGIENKKQYVDKLQRDLENWTQDVKENTKREDRRRALEIDRAKIDLDYAHQSKKDKEAGYQDQLDAVHTALSSIEQISKSAPQG